MLIIYPIWFIVEYDKKYRVKIRFKKPMNEVILLINNNNPTKPHLDFSKMELFK